MAQKYLDMSGLTRYHEGLLDYMAEAVGTQSDMSVTDPANMAYINNVPDWVRSETKPEYNAEEVGADATGTAHTEMSNHDVSETAHEDIRNLIQEINTQIEESTWDDKYTQEEVDGKDATTLTSAKSYTDSSVSSTLTEAKTYAEGQATNALTEAKSYADTASASALKDAKEYNDTAYANANAYTDQKISDLINGAPTTLDTLGEIATAMSENEDVVEVLNDAIGTKANQTELDTHTGNNTIHITSTERTKWNTVDNKLESELAVDFGEAATPAFQENINTLTNKVDDLKSDLSELSSEIDNQSQKLFEYGTVGNDITNASFITLLGEGLNSMPDVANGRIIAEINEAFDTYYFYAWENELSIYFSETDQPAYLSITTIDNPTTEWVNRSNGNGFEIYGSNPIRYRTFDGNLPTEANPLPLSTGAMCALTITHGENTVLYVQNQPTSLLNNNIRLNTEQIEQVFQKKSVIEYVSNSSEDSSPNALNIYIPTNNGYVKYVFAHCVKQDINADVWRIANAYATDNLFNVLYNITTNGEWECALKIDGRNDFSGGRMHGDEVMSSIKFFIDGKVFTPNEITEKTTFKEIRIIQTSTLYDASDSVTAVAIHTSEHIFKNSENDCDVTIRQTVKWLGNYQLSNCYLAMFPISKDTSSEVYTDIDYTSEAITNNMIKNNVKSVHLYSEENGVFASFSIGKYVNDLEGGNRFQISDNGGADYNKCYYHCCSNASVQEGDLWQTESMYNIQID